MDTVEREINAASLRVSSDLGHGGAYSEYTIRRTPDGCEASVRIGRSFPSPGEGRFRPRELRETLRKGAGEANEFLARLSQGHRVFELTDLPCPHAFLHPTFYRFDFTDARGVAHGFEYSVEAGRHHGDAHQKLIEDFEKFFEAERVAREFYGRARDA